MEKSSQLLLTFLLNACWQIVLITAVAALCARLLRAASARYKHLLWVATLILCFALPALTCLPPTSRTDFNSRPPHARLSQSAVAGSVPAPTDAPLAVQETAPLISIDGNWAALLGALYLVFLCYRASRLLRAWRQTKALARSAAAAPLGRSQPIIERCKAALGIRRVHLLYSAVVPVPITVGSRNPLVILPEPLSREAEADVLTAAIGHELVHVLRRDYALNLFYELIYLPLAFHPALWPVRRQIKQTRELRCDELVAERLLEAEAYARSLVHLASSALPPSRRAEPLTVGINDADILEVRVMSLLRKTKSSVRKNRFLLIAAGLFLAVPCVAAASFAFQFSISRPTPGLIAGVAVQEPQEQKEKAAHRRAEEREMQERAERDPQFKTELDARERHKREELEARAKNQVELARVAKVTMDQAIQVVTSQHAGKVMDCSLVGQHWEAPGKLAKDSLVFYHVLIVSGDETSPATTHVWVNAIDGNIIKTEKE